LELELPEAFLVKMDDFAAKMRFLQEKPVNSANYLYRSKHRRVWLRRLQMPDGPPPNS
jgi:hypothetical protein